MIRSLIPLLVLLTACGDSAKAPTQTAPPVPENPTSGALAELEAEIQATLNPEVNACDDFYEYACGGWTSSYTLPPDKTRYSRSFTTIHERNELLLKGILEDAVKNPGDNADLQRVGALYGSCLNEDALTEAGVAPLAPLLESIKDVNDLNSFMALSGQLGMLFVDSPIGAEVYGDSKDPSLNILHIGQSGLGLPDRDYYLDLNEDEEALLADYTTHVAKMLQLTGTPEAGAQKLAQTVVALETQLAEIALPKAELRDPIKTYNRIELDGAEALMPDLSLAAYLAGAGYPNITTINVSTPSYFTQLNDVLKNTSPAALRAYLRWNVIVAFAGELSPELVQANFDFYGTRLRGQAELQPRWKRCVSKTQGHLGDVLAKVYVERAFSGNSKEKSITMITDIEHAFKEGLAGLDWMDDQTRGGAMAKVKTLKNKIGFPDEWRSYEALSLTDDHFANMLAARAFRTHFEMDKVGNPVDPNEWFMSASEVNAYYNPLANEMAFPAGILQPPFFSADFPAAMNYGAIGMVMGHELTHGFDDSGAKFDPYGKMVEWWAPEATERFEAATQCVEKQYDAFEVQPGLHVKGALTLGENIADSGGIKSTYRAYQAWEAANGKADKLAGFTGEQLLFVAFAQGWCTVMTPEAERERVATDPHSPPKFRVNGPLVNLPEFAEAFGCESGTPMNPVDQCEVW